MKVVLLSSFFCKIYFFNKTAKAKTKLQKLDIIFVLLLEFAISIEK